MPSNIHKSAAVPYVNQKGERSMKRVKVERYVAGKKPAYANDDDDEEYYTTDEELEGEEEDAEDRNDYGDEPSSSNFIAQVDKKLSHQRDSESESNDERQDDKPSQRHKDSENYDNDEEDEDDDDPRFRRLKQIETSRPRSEHLLNVQKSHQIQAKFDGPSLKNIVIENDDDEEEIKKRHALARNRQLEEPLGPQAIFGDLKKDNQYHSGDDDDDNDDDLLNKKNKQKKRIDTDDLLKDFKLTGLGSLLGEDGSSKRDEEREAEEQKLKEALEQAKQEAKFVQQLNKKIEDDLKRELEREALAKGDIGAREMSSVNTDDEDDELAYEEWKLREIKRVLRDQSERMLESREQRAIKSR